MISAIVILTALALIFGLMLGFAAVRYKVEDNPVVEQVDSILPQTQCGQCGYPGCRPYAEAIVSGEADINQCPPGGQAGVDALSELLGVESKPLSKEYGVAQEEKLVAVINEEICIGCTLCIQACPVDAILGASKQMHTVILDECTGCELCLPPCPVECIDMVLLDKNIGNWKWPCPDDAADNIDNINDDQASTA